ncbi:MAG: DUF3471 domain-containing protein [Saprospiraceae bacterium]
MDKNACAGTYSDPLFGQISVAATDDGFALSFATARQLDATLTHWHDNTWRIHWNTSHAWFDFGTLQFATDNNGQVTSLLFDVPNDDIFFEEIKAKKE